MKKFLGVSILILLDYLLLFSYGDWEIGGQNPVSILILLDYLLLLIVDLFNFINKNSLNPYFIGLSTLILGRLKVTLASIWSQSLFYWIIYSYHQF